MAAYNLNNLANYWTDYNTRNTINAFGGNDRVYGNGGNDRIYLGAGNDTVNGGTGNVTLYSNSGSDRYQSGDPAGYDTVADYDDA